MPDFEYSDELMAHMSEAAGQVLDEWSARHPRPVQPVLPAAYGLADRVIARLGPESNHAMSPNDLRIARADLVALFSDWLTHQPESVNSTRWPDLPPQV